MKLYKPNLFIILFFNSYFLFGQTLSPTAQKEALLIFEQHYQQAISNQQAGELAAAKKTYQAAVEHLLSLDTIFRLQLADTYFNLAQLETSYLQQVGVLQKGIAALCRNFETTNSYQNPQISQVLYPKQVLNFVNFKIFVLQQHWKSSKGDDRYLNIALKTCHFADGLITQIRKNIATDIAEKEKQLPKFLMAYEQGMDIASTFFTETGNTAYFDQAFYFSERKKAILLAENILNTQHQADIKKGTIPADLVQKESNLKKELAQINIAIQQAQAADDIEKSIQLQQEQQQPLKTRLAKVSQDIRDYYPEFYAFQYEIDIPRIETIQSLLDAETVIVVFSANDAMSKHIYNGANKYFSIFTISQEDVTITKIDWSQDLNKEVVAYHKALNKLSIVRTKNFQKFLNRSHLLYKKLIRPINKYIKNGKNLIFIVEDQQNYLPFESLIKELPQEVPKSDFTNLDFLLKYFSISYHYSATLLFNSLTSKKKGNDFFGFGPVFAGKDSTTLDIPSLINQIDSVAYNYQRGDKFAPLFWSELELKHTAKLFHQQSKALPKLALREKATKALLKHHLEKPYDFIHVATHSFANLQYPELSGIVCHPNSDNSETENILRMGEIYHFDIQSNLVVLSSCESGYGELLGGEGMLGLNRAFVFAGTPNVLYSLWKVNDKITAHLMIEFYRQVLSGQSYASALRIAKLKTLKEEGTALPMYWTAFQLIGR